MLLLAGLTACSSSSTSLSATEFQKLTSQPGVVVLDVRTPAEYSQGHLPNAINVDVESADFSSQIATLDTGATYAIYCRSGNRTKSALDQMQAAGFTDVQELDGGILAWQSANLPLAA